MNNKERRKLIKKAASKIRKLEDLQQKEHRKLIKQLNIGLFSVSDNIIYDHLFNKFGTLKEVVQRAWPRK